MNTFRKIAVLFLTLAFVFAGPASQAVTTQSNVATVALTATVPISLTVSVGTGSLNFTDATLSAPISVTTSWNLSPTQASMVITMAYFNSATALTGTPGDIPTSGVIFSGSNGTAACNVSQTFGGITFPNSCGPNVGSIAITTNLQSSMNNTFQLQIPSFNTLAPGSYNGTLNIQAVAF